MHRIPMLKAARAKGEFPPYVSPAAPEEARIREKPGKSVAGSQAG